MNADDQFHANLAFLATRPGMEAMVAQLPTYPLTNMQLQPGAQGQLFGAAWDRLTQQWGGLCSPEDPTAEAEADCNALYSRDTKVFTLLGLGLGYFAVALAKRLQPWQRLVIWDVDPVMFKAMLYAVDIAPLFSEKRTDVMIGDSVIDQVEGWWLKLEAVEKLAIREPFRSGYTGVVHKSEYDALMDKNIEMMRFHAVGLSTWRIFGGAIGDNDLQNMPDYFMTPGFLTLKDIWQGRPAVCLAAGPSLQRNLRQLFDPEIRDRLAVISVGTIYGLIHGLGLEPDIVTTIDFQARNWEEQFRRIPLDVECPLVYLHSTYPQTVRRWPGPRFVATNASDTTGWIGQYAEQKGSAAQVQTVAHLNVMVALEMGANPILLLGQDLAMPPTEHHTAGARAADIAPADAPEEGFLLAPDYQGKQVHTRHSFLSMRTVFERIVKEHPDRTFINCSEGGLKIEGALHMSLKDALSMMREAADAVPAGRGVIRRKARDIFETYTPAVQEKFWSDWEGVCTAVEELATWAVQVPALLDAARKYDARDVSPDIWAATTAEDVMSQGEVVDMLAAARWEVLLGQERIIQERHVALSLFAIRRFDFLELMGEVPPKEEDVSTHRAKCAYNGERLGRVATMIREEVAVVRRLLREASRRMDGMFEMAGETTTAEISRAASRQNYEGALDKLRRRATEADGVAWASNKRYQELYLHYLWHTQQYEAALGVMHAWGLAPRKQALAQRYLAQWRADVRQALPAYFQETGEQQQQSPAEPWLYD